MKKAWICGFNYKIKKLKKMKDRGVCDIEKKEIKYKAGPEELANLFHEITECVSSEYGNCFEAENSVGEDECFYIFTHRQMDTMCKELASIVEQLYELKEK